MSANTSPAVPKTTEKALEDVARFLLEHGYLLTALEFHQELIENGTELSVLKKKFDSSPDAVLREEKAKTSEGTVSASLRDQLLKEKDELKEKLSMAQSELQAAKDTINNLRFQLTKAGSAPKTVVFPTGDAVGPKDANQQLEVRALNYLIRKYLLEHGFKLSAISLDQEVVDQDLSEWSMVGAQTPEPPNLPVLYRHFLKGAVIVNANREDKKKLEDFLPGRNNELAKQSSETGSSSAVKLIAGYKRNRLSYAATAPKYEATTDIAPEELANHARITQQLQKIVLLDKDEQALVRVSGESLPYIVPGVILKKREEVLPIVISVIHRHPDKAIRFSLTQLLFNLIKKPNEYERKMIIDGFLSLAKIIGEERTETELLPQCWEEITNKHPERRILVAESCGALAVYVRPELRPSLILSILQQLTVDRDPLVREAVARNLGLIVSLFDTDDKYGQVEDLVFQLLYDREYDVRVATQKYVLPFFADWADTLGVLCTKLTNRLLNELSAIVSKPTFGTSNVEGDAQKVSLLVTSFNSVVPRLRETVLLAGPFSDKAQVIPDVLTPQQDKLLQAQFETALMDPTLKWNEFDWLVDKCLTRLVQIGTKVNITNATVLTGVVGVISKICSAFGKDFSKSMMKKLFIQDLGKAGKESQPARIALLPIYLGAVAATDEATFVQFFKEVTVSISTQEQGWSRDQMLLLSDSVKMVCKSTERATSQVLNVLWDLLVHPVNYVRVCVVTLFDGIISVLTPDEVAKRVLPALVTLGSDPDKMVKFATLRALSSVAANVEDSAIMDKITVQLNSFLEDQTQAARIELAKNFKRMIPLVQAKFRDTYLLPKLVGLVQGNRKNQNQTERAQMAQLLFECFHAFHGCLLDEDAIRDYIVPGLRLLQADQEILDTTHKALINSMINDMEAAISDDTPATSHSGHTQSAQGGTRPASTQLGGRPSQPQASVQSPSTTANLLGMGANYLDKFMKRT
eukprot:TRINITY_DN3251_c0_g1_i1.p1 TRINITY_DN3251_c0_g1~~TRINITY_DN3251_c0_g1_i1.p1  ORF type:complete len:976 (-),score=360.72 TRINITY_DN3251_c0_g1_i1:1541-4468(-)